MFAVTHFPSRGGFCTGASTQGMEPRAKRGCIVPEHITVSFPEDVRTYEEWATYPVDVLQLVCSQVGLAPARLEARDGTEVDGFFPIGGHRCRRRPGPATAGGNDSTWSPSGGHAAPVASVPAVPLPVAHPVILPFQFTWLGPAAEVPDEVIRAVHDLEVRRLCAPGFGFVLA